MKRGLTVPPAGRRGLCSLKTGFLNRCWPQEWSGWVRTGRRIHLVFVSGPTVDSGPDSDHFRCFGTGPELWSTRIGPGLSSVETRQMSQQQSSVLSQQQTSVLSQQKTSILSQQKTRQLPASGRLLLCLLLRQDRCLLLRQDRCLLLRRDRCLLLRQDRCLLLRQARCKILRKGGSRMLKSAACRSNRDFWNSSGADRNDRRRPAHAQEVYVLAKEGILSLGFRLHIFT